MDWLVSSEVQSDALLDLQTKGNALSVYKVDDEQEIDRAVIALAANRDHIANLDYAIFDDSLLKAYDIALVQVDGETPDSVVNKMHFDAIRLTASKLSRMAWVISLGERRRVNERTVENRIREAINYRWLDLSKMKEGVVKKVS